MEGLKSGNAALRNQNLRNALATFALASVTPVLAAEGWPDQPYAPPVISAQITWPADKLAMPASAKTSFCAQGEVIYQRSKVRRGGLIATRGNVLFFLSRDDLFEGPRHAITQGVRILPQGHPFKALEDISASSAGGRAHDDLFGDGFVRWERSSGEQFPDWRELFHSNAGDPCGGGHYFVHHPPGSVKPAFIRPAWPMIRNRHFFEREEERWQKAYPGRKRLRVLRGF